MKKLYRSRKDTKIAGVCGGIAEYFNIDSTVIRLLAVLTIFFGGGGLVVYIIGWIIIPLKPAEGETAQANENTTRDRKKTNQETTIDAEIIDEEGEPKENKTG